MKESILEVVLDSKLATSCYLLLQKLYNSWVDQEQSVYQFVIEVYLCMVLFILEKVELGEINKRMKPAANYTSYIPKLFGKDPKIGILPQKYSL